MNEVLKRDGLNLIISPCPPHKETTPQNATQLARTDANLVLEPCAYTFRCAVHTICSSPKAPGNPERGPGNTSISSVRNFTKNFEQTSSAFKVQSLDVVTPRHVWFILSPLEMKSSRAAIGRDIALIDLFHSFFSFPASKGGYSGVAVYTDTRTATPLKAEEGLSGGFQPKIPSSPEERISTSYPLVHELDLVPDADGQTPNDLLTLDLEGRSLVLDFGLFVLINLYCPNEGSDARFSYKMNYHLMLQERVRGLIAAGREVVVLGDLNVCAAPIDHCDVHLPSNASAFWEYPTRAWMRDWLAPRGPLIDVHRRFWPDRKGMFTCMCHISTCCDGSGTYIIMGLVRPHSFRLEYEDQRTRNKLWHAYWLRARHARSDTLDQGSRYPAVHQRLRSLPCICRPSRRDYH